VAFQDLVFFRAYDGTLLFEDRTLTPPNVRDEEYALATVGAAAWRARGYTLTPERPEHFEGSRKLEVEIPPEAEKHGGLNADNTPPLGRGRAMSGARHSALNSAPQCPVPRGMIYA
jgi:hypothetical protein